MNKNKFKRTLFKSDYNFRNENFERHKLPEFALKVGSKKCKIGPKNVVRVQRLKLNQNMAAKNLIKEHIQKYENVKLKPSNLKINQSSAHQKVLNNSIKNS